jgi:hypothetical protein
MFIGNFKFLISKENWKNDFSRKKFLDHKLRIAVVMREARNNNQLFTIKKS